MRGRVWYGRRTDRQRTVPQKTFNCSRRISDTISLSDTLNCESCGRKISVEAKVCTCGTGFDPVRRVSEAALERLGHKEDAELPKSLFEDPTDAGYRPSRLGKRKGQSRDYRMSASMLRGDDEEGDGRELHLREYEDRFTLHWDAYSAKNPMHAVKDAPDYGAACVAAVGIVAAAVGSGFVRRRGRKEEDGSGIVEKASGGETTSTEEVDEETERRIRDVIPSIGFSRGFVGSVSERLGNSKQDD